MTDDLRAALDAVLSGVPVARLTDPVQRLIGAYRSGAPAATPVLVTMVDAVAYAAYRMPATHAAVTAALAQVPGLAPRTQLDLGGGTGAASWAATDALRSIERVTVFDQVPEALKLGQRIAAHATGPALRTATWQDWRHGDEVPLPAADLVTVAYVLGELTGEAQADLVGRAAGAAAECVLVVEPGTPAGYRRILGARQVLLDAGFTVAAPCPHQEACGMSGRDWCHFAVRINRSALHRRLKQAELGHEDEKFCYVAAVRSASPVDGRIVRHPVFRKGLVTLQVCAPDRSVGPVLVSKRQGEVYKRARDAQWGAAWPAR